MTHAFSITYIHAGEATSVIPSDVTFGGTIRTLDQAGLLDIRSIIIKSLASFSDMYGFTYEAEFEIDGFGDEDAPSAPLINDRELTEQLRHHVQIGYGDVVESFTPNISRRRLLFLRFESSCCIYFCRSCT